MHLLPTRMQLFYFVLILSTEAMSQCSRHKDYQTCSEYQIGSNQSCSWCHQNQTCYDDFPLKNACIDQNVRKLDHCGSQNNGNFSYNAEEAYKLALFSATAYSEEPGKCLKALFPKTDYTNFSVYLKKCDDYWFTYNKRCLAFTTISHRNREIIVAFRGTEGVTQFMKQVLVTLGSNSVASAVGGKVQRYFYNMHKKLYHNIKHLIKDLIQRFPKYLVKLTGHSLGGTAASITSAMLIHDKVLKAEQVLLYTFGMPRVGNKQYADAHDRLVPNSWRIVRSNDIIVELPFCSSFFSKPYHHGTEVRYIGTKMRKHSAYVCGQTNNSRCKYTRRKRGALNFLFKPHKFYFGIPIGSYCSDHILNHSGP